MNAWPVTIASVSLCRNAVLAQDQRNAITLKRNREQSNRPHSGFERSVELNTVVSVGDDYIALAPLEEPSQKILIPFYRVGRVVVTASQDPSGTDRKTK